MKTKIRVEMDQQFVWWPVSNALLNNLTGQEPTLLVDSSILERYDKVKKEFYDLQSIMEELWRAQEGMSVDPSIVPESAYSVLDK
jgi:hypothetical protein